MFIDESEGIERLRDPRNVLSRVPRVDRTEVPSIPDLNIPSLVEIAEEVEKTDDPSSKLKTDSFDPFASLQIQQLISPNTPGRKANIRNRTDEENAAVAVSSLMLGPTATQQLFGVSGPQQHVLTDGYTGSVAHGDRSKKPREALLEEIHRQGGKIVTKAFNRIDQVLDRITPEKLDGVSKATDLTQIASGMAKIIQSLTPKEGNADEGGVHFHVYRPEQASITDYEMVVVGAGKSDGAASTNV